MIIMNPPYDKNLHLKILDEVLREYPDETIINLSPIRWLQDPLAARKKNSDWNKFENVRNHIEDLRIIDVKDANDLFKIASTVDLGIYKLSLKGGWVNPWQSKLVDKIVDNMKDNIKNHLIVDNFNGICLAFSKFISGKYTNTGLDVDTGATNRKLGSDMGRSVTSGGLHGEDLSKADVSINIYAFLKAQKTGKSVEISCAIGDEIVDGKPYSEIVEVARNYIQSKGGFEQFAEWGLIDGTM